jgi:putative hydrolase of the HAD superfamily
MIETVIFDFDNTIYNYDICNNKALTLLFSKIVEDFNLDIYKIENIYNKLNKNIKFSNNHSNKFNKSIYILKLLEELNISINLFDKYYNIYNTEFDNNLVIYDYIEELLILFKKNNIKIGLLSNNIFIQQYNKLQKLNIIKYFDAIQTSDECGEEKPNILPYLSILHKLKANPENTIFIGDNLYHDIYPSLKLGLLAFYYNKDLVLLSSLIQLHQDKYIEFNNFNNLYNFFIKYFETVHELIFLSKYFGQSNLNVQGPGGNISVKLENIIFIKSSGAVLGNISYNEGYCLANNNDYLNVLSNELLNENNNSLPKILKLFGYKIPSMETFFHSFMKKYTVHIHMTLANIFLCTDYKDLDNFPYKYKIIEYIPPGLLLATHIKKLYNDDTDVYFLKNHGLIITNDNYLEVLNMYESIYLYFQNKINNTNNIKNSTIQNNFNNELITFYINKQLYLKNKMSKIIRYIDYPLNILLNIKYCFPDLAIFIEKISYIKNINDLDDVNSKTNIIIYESKVYLIATTLNKIYYILELLDKYKILCSYSYDKLLEINDINYIQNMEEEKFRKTL